MIAAAFDLAERGVVPDAVIRLAIRRMLAARLREEDCGDPEAQAQKEQRLLEELACGPIAELPDAANRQHYEVPAELFRLILGPRLKYSCCYWPPGVESLAAAEEAMLALTCARAEVASGMRILDLGCGWGSLTLWMAERYPGCEITAVSNSTRQRAAIEAECAHRGVRNVTVVTADMNDFATERRFDRVVSVEMFEHMRNYCLLLRRIAGWLAPGGKLFVHLFCHRSYAYLYEPAGPSDWMAREFFSGGTMPSDSLLLRYQEDLVLEGQWRVSGEHYRRTLEAWRERLDAQRAEVESALGGAESVSAARGAQRWRLFLMACAELFGYRGGSEWWVAHYLFRRRDTPGASL